jgi:hypothetical protein
MDTCCLAMLITRRALDRNSNFLNWPTSCRLLYRAFFDELRFSKQQQWTITNYTVLLVAGVLGVAKAISPATFGKFI